jgi:hypothetical protein
MQDTTSSTFVPTTQARACIATMRKLCVKALRRMYVAEDRLFCHCIRRTPEGDRPEGVSRRYTAMVLLGLAAQEDDLAPAILPEVGTAGVCARLLSDIDRVDNLGDVAVTLWAAIALGHPQADRALQRLRKLDPVNGPHPTVEIAWSLTALSVMPDRLTDETLREQVARRLLGSQDPHSGLFPHYPPGAAPSAWRAHVTCFADWVYPVQALSHYHTASGDAAALHAARRAAELMCRLQGPEGQWWWHYDVRTGLVVEPFPVYSVHQDAMGPMALFALSDAGGGQYDQAINRSVAWMIRNPERGDSLVDEQAGLIWRKIGRAEPGKLSRGIQAAASRLHPSLRAPGLNVFFAPRAIDYESRPYHLGWVLYTFSDRRMAGSRREPVLSGTADWS